MREEDDLRAALHTLEQHTPDPDQILAAIRASGRPAPPPRRWRQAMRAPLTWGPTWMAPLAAAAAVVAVVASSIVVAGAFAPGQAPGGRAHRVTTTAPPLPRWDGLPAYFAEASPMRRGSQPRVSRLTHGPIPLLARSHVVYIMATATGRVAATARLPGYVTGISASAGAFFAASFTGSAATFYEIRLTNGGTRAAATKLPIRPITAIVEAIAASPDGSKLAISALVPIGHPAHYAPKLIVAATATGATRSWITPVADHAGGPVLALNWLADGKTLAFTWSGATPATPSSSLRLLDTAARGDDLLSAALVLRLLNNAGLFSDYSVSPDGRAVLGIVACVSNCPWTEPGLGKGEVPGSLVQFAGGAGRVRYTEPEVQGAHGRYLTGVCNDPLWVGPAGHTVLLPCYQYRPATPARKAVTVIHPVLLEGNRMTQLPWLTAPSYGMVAFPGMPAKAEPVSFPVKS